MENREREGEGAEVRGEQKEEHDPTQCDDSPPPLPPNHSTMIYPNTQTQTS